MIQEKPVLCSLTWNDDNGDEREIQFERPDGPPLAAMRASFQVALDEWNATESARRAAEDDSLTVGDILDEDRSAYEDMASFWQERAIECVVSYRLGDQLESDATAAQQHIRDWPQAHVLVIPELTRRCFNRTAWGDNGPEFTTKTAKADKPSG